ncbi:unnamed protein product [Angiostrongylus costaricensis]|uniref:PPM-type phosphatase domain-containing protein n=1 Tax=Angiostrongylus costaricensis TaxID=334426 RepID=A0A3P7I3R5_ANGCS|nr:unnamed protein product [Angiostrongylus costaricensis]
MSSGCLLIHLGAQLSVSYVGNIGAAVLTGGHLEKLTGSVELDEEEYERIRCAGGTVDENNLVNGATLNSRQLGFYSFHPVLTPKPIEKSIWITKEMDYVIIASWAVWEFLSDAQIATILVSSLNPQVAAKTIQDSLQARDYNGNSCVMVIRLLKPERSFRSTSSEYVGCFTPVPKVIPPMRVELRKTQEDALQKIEQKLEKISEVIVKMEDETAGQNDGYISGRQLYNRIVAHEKVSNWIVSPNSSGAAPPPDPTYSGHSEFVNELKSRVGRVDFIQDENEVSVVPQHHQNNQENIYNLKNNKITVPFGENLKGTTRQQCSPAISDVTSPASYLRCPRLTSRQEQPSEITKPMSSKSKCLVGVDQYDGLSIDTDKQSHACPATSEDPWIERVESRITNEDGTVYSLCFPSTSSSSEFYSVTKARKERRLASREKFCRSFGYYSYTQVRPYSDAHEVLESPSASGLDFLTPATSMTSHLESTLPYNRRMSVIEEEVHQKFSRQCTINNREQAITATADIYATSLQKLVVHFEEQH